MKEKILIFGNGQMGNLYLNYFNNAELKNFEARIANANISEKKEVVNAIEEYQPTTVINTAAKTNLEWCSDNKLEAFNVNVLGANNIAKICDEQNIYFIHLSSGCIFESIDENDIKTEETAPNPASYYALTKVWSEEMVKFEKSADFSFAILRPRQPISAEFKHMNMLVKFLTFTKFVETPNTGTVLEDLLEWTKIIIEKKPQGIINVANKGWSTPYDIALILKDTIFPDLPIEKISKEELDKLTPNKRVDTILDVSKLESIVGTVNNYEDRLKDTITNLKAKIESLSSEEIKTQLEKTYEQSLKRTIPNKEWRKLIK